MCFYDTALQILPKNSMLDTCGLQLLVSYALSRSVVYISCELQPYLQEE